MSLTIKVKLPKGRKTAEAEITVPAAYVVGDVDSDIRNKHDSILEFTSRFVEETVRSDTSRIPTPTDSDTGEATTETQIKVKVAVASLVPHTIEVSVPSDGMVSQLKRACLLRDGCMDMSDAKLYFNGRLLSGFMVLELVGIQEGSLVEMRHD